MEAYYLVNLMVLETGFRNSSCEMLFLPFSSLFFLLLPFFSSFPSFLFSRGHAALHLAVSVYLALFFCTSNYFFCSFFFLLFCLFCSSSSFPSFFSSFSSFLSSFSSFFSSLFVGLLVSLFVCSFLSFLLYNNDKNR